MICSILPTMEIEYLVLIPTEYATHFCQKTDIEHYST